MLALVDLANHPSDTVAMAARLAADQGAELAVGGIVAWDVSHGSDLVLDLVSESLVSSLRRPARARLRGLARAAGYEGAAALIATRCDPWEATLEMVTDWHPDLLVVADKGIFDPGVKRRVTYRTPSGVSEAGVRRYRPGRRRGGGER
ncbi:MAG: hypothetical protein VW338_08290 [Rhodospirillaceae bacterium]